MEENQNQNQNKHKNQQIKKGNINNNKNQNYKSKVNSGSNNEKIKNINKTNIEAYNQKNINKTNTEASSQKNINKTNIEASNQKNVNKTNTEASNQKNLNKNNLNNKDEKNQNYVNKKVEKENIANIKDDFISKEEKDKKSSKFKKIILIILLVIIIILLCVIGYFGLNISNNKILSNVYIEEIDVSNLTKDEAKNKIENEYSKILGNDIKYSFENEEYNINFDDIDFELIINESLDDAMKIGRTGNIFKSFVDFYSLKFGNKEQVDLYYKYNKEKLNSKIKEIEDKFYKEVKQYSYSVENNILKIQNGTSGARLNYEEIEKDINESIENKNVKEIIELPLIIEEPDEIDVAKIHNEVFVEMKNAYYTLNPFEIHKEVTGVNFDIMALKEMIEAEPDKEEYSINLIITEPTTKVENLDLYKDELGICTTTYVNNPDRTTNLRLAASKVNEYVLMPGETFSDNEVVGERTVSAGYRNAAVYINGEVEDGLGGGICQISSTLYNAVVFANLDVTVRRNHQFVTSYVQAGRDATVVYGSQDFKFKNSRKYPVKISATVNSGVATISIYGIKEETEYDISFQVNTISTIPVTVSYVDDPSLESGKEVVKQSGANGVITETYKIVRQNGKVISKTLLSRDTYNAMKKVIARGTASVSTSTPTPQPQQPSTPTTQPQQPSTPTTQPEQPSTPTPQPQPEPENPNPSESENTSDSNSIEENNTQENSTI